MSRNPADLQFYQLVARVRDVLLLVRGITDCARIVGLAMANNIDRRGFDIIGQLRCWPGAKALAECLGISDRAVRMSRAALISKGVIELVGRSEFDTPIYEFPVSGIERIERDLATSGIRPPWKRTARDRSPTHNERKSPSHSRNDHSVSRNIDSASRNNDSAIPESTGMSARNVDSAKPIKQNLSINLGADAHSNDFVCEAATPPTAVGANVIAFKGDGNQIGQSPPSLTEQEFDRLASRVGCSHKLEIRLAFRELTDTERTALEGGADPRCAREIIRAVRRRAVANLRQPPADSFPRRGAVHIVHAIGAHLTCDVARAARIAKALPDDAYDRLDRKDLTPLLDGARLRDIVLTALPRSDHAVGLSSP